MPFEGSWSINYASYRVDTEKYRCSCNLVTVNQLNVSAQFQLSDISKVQPSYCDSLESKPDSNDVDLCS